MKKHFVIIVLLSILIGFSFNLHSQSSIKNIASTSVKNHELIKGRHSVIFKVNNSQKMNVSLSVPNIKPNEKVPLIIALHWAGGPNTFMEYSECLAFPALEFTNGIIVAPSDHGIHWVNELNEKKLIKLINEILKHWPVDSTKIIITGYSNGGIGSWYYAEKYPKIFCAAIPMSGTYNPTKTVIPLYVIHGKKDELFNWYKVQNTVTQSIAKGSEIQLTLLENYSHYMACSYVEILNEIAHKVEKDIFDN